jgi:hypothetical protein
VPGVVGFAGDFTDKEWMEIDLNSPSDSPCAGSVYVAYTSFHGAFGNSPIKFNRSANGGATFGQSKGISTGGPAGTPNNQGADIAVRHEIYVTPRPEPARASSIKHNQVDRCGKH